ncbi:MAG: alpha/beta hydrolase [Bacteroidota bacterium]|jgi:enterochelin esterase-like enzyme
MQPILGKIIMLLFVCFVAFLRSHAQDSLPKVTKGKVERIHYFQSKNITPRHIDIWLPPGYPDSGKYDVLYMHDGQMLFDSDNTWNKQAWEVDEVVAQLMQAGKVRNFIVVGIWNGGQTRHADYFPQKPFELLLNQTERDTINSQLLNVGRTTTAFKPQSDNYLKFIVSELKPKIDKSYSVYTNPEHTFIAGSSMGGLISLYAVCEYPEVFGGAACLSTHWPGTFTLQNNPFPLAMQLYLEMQIPDPANHRIYFDCGNQTLDALYPSLQKNVDEVMRKMKYNQTNWLTYLDEGADHSERAWHNRLHVPLIFLLSR